MAGSNTEIYRSSNGDRWQLICTPGSTSMSVRHIPNRSSGGQVTDTAVADFLSTDGPGPEYAALRRLLESRSDDVGNV
jgi:hypothetical protein